VRPGRAADHSPPSSAAVMEVGLYLYPPSGSHWACNGITLPISIISSPACFGKLSDRLQGDIFGTRIQL